VKNFLIVAIVLLGASCMSLKVEAGGYHYWWYHYNYSYQQQAPVVRSQPQNCYAAPLRYSAPLPAARGKCADPALLEEEKSAQPANEEEQELLLKL
jgi:hypothetical protein